MDTFAKNKVTLKDFCTNIVDKIILNNLFTQYIILGFVSLVIIQVIFFYMQKFQIDFIHKTIPIIFREENNLSYPYRISRTMSDYEQIGLFRCINITMKRDRNIILLSTEYKKKCFSNFFFLNGEKTKFAIAGVNGPSYEVSLISNNPEIFNISLWGTRFLILTLMFYLVKYLDVKNKKFQIQLIHAKEIEEIDEISSKYAHDIGPHLIALSRIAGMSSDELIKEENRILIRNLTNQIYEVSSQFLFKKRHSISLSSNSSCLVSSVLEEIVIEKRFYFKSHSNIFIHYDINNNKYCNLFSSINSSELTSVLSNIINNSVEAIKENKGDITLAMDQSQDGGNVIITIVDNGPGIPHYILSDLGAKEGVSFGKKDNVKSGNGIGLFHSKIVIEKAGGTFKIESQYGYGTKTTILLPEIHSPKWFAKEINIFNDNVFVIIDDDKMIHEIISNRLFILFGDRCKIYHLFNAHDLFDFEMNKIKNDNIFYFIDYELSSQSFNGLDLIKKYSLYNALLVTWHYKNTKIQAECEGIGIKMLPKNLTKIVPIIFHKKDSFIKYQNVIIDDNDYIRELWELRFKDHHQSLATMKSPNLFWQYVNQISKNAKIYIDSDLGDDHIKGELFAKILFDNGFKDLYMISGYDKKYFLKYPWVKYYGKNCPY